MAHTLNRRLFLGGVGASALLIAETAQAFLRSGSPSFIPAQMPAGANGIWIASDAVGIGGGSPHVPNRVGGGPNWTIDPAPTPTPVPFLPAPIISAAGALEGGCKSWIDWGTPQTTTDFTFLYICRSLRVPTDGIFNVFLEDNADYHQFQIGSSGFYKQGYYGATPFPSNWGSGFMGPTPIHDYGNDFFGGNGPPSGNEIGPLGASARMNSTGGPGMGFPWLSDQSYNGIRAQGFSGNAALPSTFQRLNVGYTQQNGFPETTSYDIYAMAIYYRALSDVEVVAGLKALAIAASTSLPTFRWLTMYGTPTTEGYKVSNGGYPVVMMPYLNEPVLGCNNSTSHFQLDSSLMLPQANSVISNALACGADHKDFVMFVELGNWEGATLDPTWTEYLRQFLLGLRAGGWKVIYATPLPREDVPPDGGNVFNAALDVHNHTVRNTFKQTGAVDLVADFNFDFIMGQGNSPQNSLYVDYWIDIQNSPGPGVPKIQQPSSKAHAEILTPMAYEAINRLNDTYPQTAWQSMRIGGGGFSTGIDISPDGLTKVQRADVWGAWIWNSTSNQWDDLLTIQRFPGQTIRTGTGVVEIVSAPNHSDHITLLWFGHLFMSTNRGVTFAPAPGWTKIGYENGNSVPMKYMGKKIAYDPADPNHIIVCNNQVGAGPSDPTFYGNTCLESTNGGSTFTEISYSNIPKALTEAGYLITWVGTTITVHSDGNGIYQSTNNGSTWGAVSGGPTNAMYMAAESGYVYVCERSGNDPTGKLYTLHSGTFTSQTPFTPAAGNFKTIAVDPTTPGHIIASSFGATLSVSFDFGATWTVNFNPNHTLSVVGDVTWMRQSFDDLLTSAIGIDTDGSVWATIGIGTLQCTPPANSTVVYVWQTITRGVATWNGNGVCAPMINDGFAITWSWDRGIMPNGYPYVQYANQYQPNFFQACWDISYGMTAGAEAEVFALDLWGDHGDTSSISKDGGRTWNLMPQSTVGLNMIATRDCNPGDVAVYFDGLVQGWMGETRNSPVLLTHPALQPNTFGTFPDPNYVAVNKAIMEPGIKTGDTVGVFLASIPSRTFLVANGTTSSGTNVLHFASVPPGVELGQRVECLTNPSVNTTGMCVIAKTSTTITLGVGPRGVPGPINVSANVVIGDIFMILYNGSGGSTAVGDVNNWAYFPSSNECAPRVTTNGGATWTSVEVMTDPVAVTVTNGTPGTITETAHGWLNDTCVSFFGGTLPTGLTINTPYYTIYVDVNHYQLAATPGGSAIALSGSSSGVMRDGKGPPIKFSCNCSNSSDRLTNININALKHFDITTALHQVGFYQQVGIAEIISTTEIRLTGNWVDTPGTGQIVDQDGGWGFADNTPHKAVCADGSVAKKIYCVNSVTQRCYVSTDGGLTWPVSYNLLNIANTFPYGTGYGLKAVPGQTGHIYIQGGGGTSGIASQSMKSLDGGKTWLISDTAVRPGTNDLTPIGYIGFGAPKPGGSGYPSMYAVRYVSNVPFFMQSDDAGSTWTDINSGYADHPGGTWNFVFGIDGDKQHYGRVYVCTHNDFMWRQTV